MSEQPSWNQIVSGFSRFIQDSLAQNFSNCNPPVYRVFLMKETGTYVVRRSADEAEASESVFGPDTFAACMKWMNEQAPERAAWQ